MMGKCPEKEGVGLLSYLFCGTLTTAPLTADPSAHLHAAQSSPTRPMRQSTE
jgi:hypothetical protein